MNPQYTRRLEKIEAVLQNWLPENPGASWLDRVFDDQENPSPGNLPPAEAGRFPVSPALAKSLTQSGWDLVNRGGKRWRPLLMTLIAESLGGEDAALPLTPLVEFPHNASLIHDDIEDNSDERRGKPAVHLLYGTDTAINGGAFLYFLPLACLSAWDGGAEARPGAGALSLTERKNRIYAVWGEHMRRLHLGQAMDIAWHRDFSSLPTLEEYDRMCRLKTGCLARLAAILGVYAVDPSRYDPEPLTEGGTGSSRTSKTASLAVGSLASASLAAAFGEAAENLGVGFQILDDVKNLSAGVPGKKRGDDVVEGKKSLPILLFLQETGSSGTIRNHRERQELVFRCFTAARERGSAAAEVEELIGALEAAGVLEEARRRGLALIGEARSVFSQAAVSGIPLRQEGRELLAGLMDLIS